MVVAVKKLVEYVLQDATVTYASAASGIAEIKLSLSHLIQRTQIMKASIVEKHGKSWDDFYKIIVAEMGELAHEIREDFPPPHHAENHAERQLLIAKALAKVEGGVIRALVAIGISEDEARLHFGTMKPHIRNILVTAGKKIA